MDEFSGLVLRRGGRRNYEAAKHGKKSAGNRACAHDGYNYERGRREKVSQQIKAALPNTTWFPSRKPCSGLGTVGIFLKEAFVAIVGGSELATNKEILDVGREFERIAVRDDDVGDFPCLQSADL